MIKMLFRLVFLVLMLGGWTLAALSLHVVRTPDKVIVIPKDRLGFADTYVDARKWTVADLPNHPDLLRRVLETNKSDLFIYVTGKDAIDQLRNALPGPDKAATQSRLPSVSGLDLPVDF